MHFNDAINLDLQKPNLIEYYNQMKSGADTVDQMIATPNVARNTRSWPMVIFYKILNIAAISAQTIHMLNSNVKISCRIFIRNLITRLVSEQIKKHSEISTGVHKPIHLKLHQFQKEVEGNSTNDIDMAPSTEGEKEKIC